MTLTTDEKELYNKLVEMFLEHMPKDAYEPWDPTQDRAFNRSCYLLLRADRYRNDLEVALEANPNRKHPDAEYYSPADSAYAPTLEATLYAWLYVFADLGFAHCPMLPTTRSSFQISSEYHEVVELFVRLNYLSIHESGYMWTDKISSAMQHGYFWTKEFNGWETGELEKAQALLPSDTRQEILSLPDVTSAIQFIKLHWDGNEWSRNASEETGFFDDVEFYQEFLQEIGWQPQKPRFWYRFAKALGLFD